MSVLPMKTIYQHVDVLMTQAQVFASSWALVGTPIDKGDELATAEAEKTELRKQALTALRATAAAAASTIDANTLRNLVAWVDSRVEAEVTHRPDVNIYKQTLSGTWRQVRTHLLARLAECDPAVEYSPPVIWRCFHCDEAFSDSTAAQEHFGTSIYQQPACQIDVAEYRAMEQRMQRDNDEDSDMHRQIASLQCEHQAALRREEEKGYARGLADAAHQNGTPVGATEGCVCADVGRHYCPEHSA